MHLRRPSKLLRIAGPTRKWRPMLLVLVLLLLVLLLLLPPLHPDGAQAQGKAGIDPLVLAGQANLVGAAGRVPGREGFHHFQFAAAGRSRALFGNRQIGDRRDLRYWMVFASNPTGSYEGDHARNARGQDAHDIRTQQQTPKIGNQFCTGFSLASRSTDMPPLGCSTVIARQPSLKIPPFSQAILSSVSPRTYTLKTAV